MNFNDSGFWFLGEFLGTMMLMLLGNGIVYNTHMKRLFGNNPSKWFLICVAWGIAVLVGICVGKAIGSAGHLNPAVTLFITISDSAKVVTQSDHGVLAGRFFIYIIAQFLGAMVAQIIVNLLNIPSIKDQNNTLASIRTSHCTAPAYHNTKEKGLWSNVGHEFVGTVILLGVVLALGQVYKTEETKFFEAPFVGALIAVLIMCLGGSTGCAMNPARDLSPRIIFWFLLKFLKNDPRLKQEKITANFSYGWVPVAIPFLAATVVGVINYIYLVNN